MLCCLLNLLPFVLLLIPDSLFDSRWLLYDCLCYCTCTKQTCTFKYMDIYHIKNFLNKIDCSWYVYFFGRFFSHLFHFFTIQFGRVLFHEIRNHKYLERWFFLLLQLGKLYQMSRILMPVSVKLLIYYNFLIYHGIFTANKYLSFLSKIDPASLFH